MNIERNIVAASAWIDLYPNTCCYLHKGSFSHPCGNPMACKAQPLTTR